MEECRRQLQFPIPRIAQGEIWAEHTRATFSKLSSAVDISPERYNMSVTTEMILDYWTSGQLKKWPKNALRNSGINDASKEFLHQIGLPIRIQNGIQFEAGADDLHPLSHSARNCRIIGFDLGRPFCIVEDRSSCVIWLDGRLERFANTSVKHFAACIFLYLKWNESVKSFPVGRLKVDELIEQIQLEDPSALDKPENVWSVVLEDLLHSS